ncbi:MAG: hypothetical protein ABIF87_14460 [Pseudomonadota bacterium]
MNEDRLRSNILAEMLKFQTIALRSLAGGSPFGFARSVDQWYILNELLGREKEDPFRHVYEFVREYLNGT